MIKSRKLNKLQKFLCNLLVVAAVLCACLGICLMIHNESGAMRLIPAIFVLGSFFISIFTEGYTCGIASVFISVLAVNYAFTFPYFSFNFTIQENMVSAVIMIIISVITCAMTTKLKKQEALRAESETERMRANLLRAVSHDLRTPLTTIYGAGSALLDGGDGFSAEQREKMLRGICKEAQWLSRMVENLLSITRLDSGNVNLIKTPTVLDELIDSVLVKFNKRYPEVEVTTELPDEFVVIPMDAILIEQVIFNLLENAALHADGMTKLVLNVHTEGNRAVFSVIDDGCGIEQERLKNIFNGASGEVTADCHKHNAGIGLSLCATIIRAHGGVINAETAKDGGTVFRFELDREEEDEQQI